MKLREYVAMRGLEHTWIEVNVPGMHSRNPVFSGYPCVWYDMERPFYMDCDVRAVEPGVFTNFPWDREMRENGIRILVS